MARLKAGVLYVNAYSSAMGIHVRSAETVTVPCTSITSSRSVSVALISKKTFKLFAKRVIYKKAVFLKDPGHPRLSMNVISPKT
jgi:hypothetical protein